jgi:hypothetical protein
MPVVRWGGGWTRENGTTDDDEKDDEDDNAFCPPPPPRVIDACRGGVDTRHHFRRPLLMLDVIMIFAHASLVLDCMQLEHNGIALTKKPPTSTA